MHTNQTNKRSKPAASKQQNYFCSNYSILEVLFLLKFPPVHLVWLCSQLCSGSVEGALYWSPILGGPGEWMCRWDVPPPVSGLQSPGPQPPANILSITVLRCPRIAAHIGITANTNSIPQSSRTRKISCILFKNLMYSHILSILWRVEYKSRLRVWG